jgi:dTDP-4-dehydrorhamnose reductase
VVDDQRGSPTWTVDLAEAIELLVDGKCRGIYHASNAGHATWQEFAQKIFRTTGKDTEVVPITTEQYNAPAVRPKNSVFDLTKLTAATGRAPRHWTEALAEYLAGRGREAGR